jgi:hypothetical protein
MLSGMARSRFGSAGEFDDVGGLLDGRHAAAVGGQP